MLRAIAIFAGLLTLCLSAKCIIVEDSHHCTEECHCSYRVEVEKVTYTDTAYVIVLEYFGYDWDTIIYFRTYYPTLYYTDWFLCLWLARHLNRPYQEILVVYYDRKCDWFSTYVFFGYDVRLIFVDIPPDIHVRPPFGRAYGYYRRSPHITYLTNDELYLVIQHRILVDFYGFAPQEVIYKVSAGEDIKVIMEKEYKLAGKPGKDCLGRELVKKERPWDEKTKHAYLKNKRRIEKDIKKQQPPVRKEEKRPEKKHEKRAEKIETPPEKEPKEPEKIEPPGKKEEKHPKKKHEKRPEKIETPPEKEPKEPEEIEPPGKKEGKHPGKKCEKRPKKIETPPEKEPREPEKIEPPGKKEEKHPEKKTPPEKKKKK